MLNRWTKEIQVFLKFTLVTDMHQVVSRSLYLFLLLKENQNKTSYAELPTRFLSQN